jgi:hypothetical protein
MDWDILMPALEKNTFLKRLDCGNMFNPIFSKGLVPLARGNIKIPFITVSVFSERDMDALETCVFQSPWLHHVECTTQALPEPIRRGLKENRNKFKVMKRKYALFTNSFFPKVSSFSSLVFQKMLAIHEMDSSLKMV